jgi:AGCS family alanine or glycine:cation symporter
MTGLVIVSTGVWEQKHDVPFLASSLENTYEIEQGNTLIIVDGVPTNGNVIRNDHPTGEFYTDEGRTQLFNGSISLEGDTYVAKSIDGNEVAELHSSIIENGAPLTALAFEKGLPFAGGKYIVTICVILFGISTAISWSYYGDRSIQYLAGDKSIIYYKMVYLVMHFLGAILALETVWAIGDIALGLMTFPNIIALFALSGTVAVASKTYFAKMKDQTGK